MGYGRSNVKKTLKYKKIIVLMVMMVSLLTMSSGKTEVKAEELEITLEDLLEGITFEVGPDGTLIIVDEDENDKSLDYMVLPSYALPEGHGLSALRDDNTETAEMIPENSVLGIKADEKIYGVYVTWDCLNLPGEWKLEYGSESIVCGKDGFLREFIEIPGGADTCRLSFTGQAGICELEVFGEGEIPDRVQRWEKLDKDADILIFVPHEGDEIADFGAVEAIYAGKRDLRVKVVYMCEYTSSEERMKEYEKLDSLWKLGVKYYPEMGKFRNKLLMSYQTADKFYGYDNVLSFATENIRRFKPIVVVAPDIEGENGNAVHMLLAKAVIEAVEISGDDNVFWDLVEKYGIWDVPKTYLHNYVGNGAISLDMGNGVTELLEDAIKSRKAESWCGSLIEGAEFSADNAPYFGLYRTNVRVDKRNDMMDNVRSYQDQEDLAKYKAERDKMAAYEKENNKYNEQLIRVQKEGNYLYGKYLFDELGTFLDKIRANEWE